MLCHLLKVSPILSILQEEAPNEDTTEEDEEIEISMWEAITWLAVLTIWISVLSEYLVNAIEVFYFFHSSKGQKNNISFSIDVIAEVSYSQPVILDDLSKSVLLIVSHSGKCLILNFKMVMGVIDGLPN
jgi:hypothetical protein